MITSGLDYCKECPPSEVIRMQDRYLFLGTKVVKYERNIALKVKCIDCDVHPFKQFFDIAFVNECIMKLDICFRIYFQQPF